MEYIVTIVESIKKTYVVKAGSVEGAKTKALVNNSRAKEPFTEIHGNMKILAIEEVPK